MTGIDRLLKAVCASIGLAAVLAGGLFLLLRERSGPEDEEIPQAVLPAATEELPDLGPKKAPIGNSISGRVLSMDGRGIGGAKVYAYHQIGDPHANQIERLRRISDIVTWQAETPAETVSAQDGSYQFDGLEKSYYTVRSMAVGFSPRERKNILPPMQSVDMPLERGGEFSGTVIDASTGTGVEGAKVMAYVHVDSSDIFQVIETRSRPPMDTGVTGPGGQFQFETLGVGVYNFIVAARGFQEASFRKIRLSEGENPSKKFVLEKGRTIAGVVLSLSGEPVAGAKVRATGQGATRRSKYIVIKFDDGSIITDAQGKFAFDTLEPGKYKLLAWHHDHATEQVWDVEAGNENITITLPTGGAISGLVTEAGTEKPIPGARVSVIDLQDLRKEGVTDDKGTYYIAGLNAWSPSKRTINIQADGYARLSNVQVFLEDSKLNENQNFELQRTAIVEGRVVDKNGKGVAKVRLMAKKRNEEAAVPMTVGSGRTEEDGKFTIRDFEGGNGIEITVLGGNYYLDMTTDPFSVKAGESITIPDIVLSLGGVIEGAVVGIDGKGIGGVLISVPKKVMSFLTDDKGYFILKGLPTGSVDLVAKSVHHLEEVVTGVKVSEGLTTRDVRIVLKEGAHVRGIILDGDGRPVPQAQVLARDVSASGMMELLAESEEDGTFLIECIRSQGTVEVTVEHPGFSAYTDERVPVDTEGLKIVLKKRDSVPAKGGPVVK